MSTHEARIINRAVDLRDAADDKAQSIVGYAAVYYREGDAATEYELWPARGNTPRAVERVMPGAFDRAIQEDDVVALFNHLDDRILGRAAAGTLKLSSDDVGLRYEIEGDDTTIFEDVRKLILKRNVRGSSFRFSVRGEDHWSFGQELEIRELQDVKLYDVGPVTFPAYQGTTTSAREARDAILANSDAEQTRLSREAFERERWLCHKYLCRKGIYHAS